MITLHLEKLYRYPRIEEHLSVAVPFKRGDLKDINTVKVFDKEKSLPIQCKVTARHEDGSVKYLFVRFMGDLPANAAKEFTLSWNDTEKKKKLFSESAQTDRRTYLEVSEPEGGIKIKNGYYYLQVKHNSDNLFDELFDGRQKYGAERFEGPYLEIRKEEDFFSFCKMKFGQWTLVEQGPLCVILKNNGLHNTTDGRVLSFEVKLTAWAGKPWVEISYRLINTSTEELDIGTLGFYYNAKNDDGVTNAVSEYAEMFKTTGTAELKEIEKLCPVDKVRTCTGYSNYKTKFTIGKDGCPVLETVTAKRLLTETNEHMSEVLYGTFFADRTDAKGGICATIFQAQQNYPKAVSADKDGLAVMLVPKGDDRVVMQPGMSREQRFLLHFHSSEEGIAELDNRSLIYQMPDRPVISPKVFEEAGFMPDIFPKEFNRDLEMALIRRADGHNHGFGMLNWGDSVDVNYTNQGRGVGSPVWSNNEYDYPHACALMYARSGARRFLDYMLVSASHWQDVDVCHYSENPLWIGGQIEHTRGHVIGGKLVPSHEWVEGLLDYYHFSGDERGLETALGIGENVVRLLETPAFAHAGELSARETGWALRTLTALFVETHDEKWLEKAEWIVGHFKQWEKEYGHWLAPYTDNTIIRVPFMIAVAVGSLMRYYRERPSKDLKEMILRAVDDMIQNCLQEIGLFYYKELPSLKKPGGNQLVLEALAIAYELTGDKSYLEAGLETYRQFMADKVSASGQRIHVGDALIWPGISTKSFAQNFIPVATYDRALETAGLR